MLRLVRLPFAWFFPALMALALSACAVTLISQYDEQTDRLTSDLQRAMTGHFEMLRSATAPACTYPNFVDFYRDRRVDVSVLDVRARSIPKNQETIRQVELIGSSLAALEEIHRDAGASCPSAQVLSPVERGLQQQFLSILTLEQAKKRGSD
jgi:hypothetical protein